MTSVPVFVDTSAFYALFAASDDNHASARGALERLRRENASLITSDMVLLETFVLVHARTRTEGLLRFREAISRSRWLREVTVSHDQEQRAWELLERRRDQDYSLIDATSFMVMQDLTAVKAFTFDRHFARAGFEAIPPGAPRRRS